MFLAIPTQQQFLSPQVITWNSSIFNILTQNIFQCSVNSVFLKSDVSEVDETENKEMVEIVKPGQVKTSVDDTAIEKEKEPNLLNRLRRFSISQVQVR